MSIKEIKSKYEKAASIIVSSMVQKDVKVETAYNADQSIMIVALTSELKGQNGEPVVLNYSIAYNEDKKTIGASAVARHYIADNFGLANILYEPISIDEDFLANMKQGISAACEHYDEIIAEDEKRKAEEEAKKAEEEKTEDADEGVAVEADEAKAE